MRLEDLLEIAAMEGCKSHELEYHLSWWDKMYSKYISKNVHKVTLIDRCSVMTAEVASFWAVHLVSVPFSYQHGKIVAQVVPITGEGWLEECWGISVLGIGITTHKYTRCKVVFEQLE